MTRLALLLLLVAAGAFATSADATAKRTCRSGTTVYKHAGVRVFQELRHNQDWWYACGPRSRRPLLLYGAPGGLGDFLIAGRTGDKLLFVTQFSGEGGGQDTEVGWFDGRTSQARTGELAGSVTNDVLDVVATKDGSVGVVAELEEHVGTRIGYLTPSKRKGELTDELALATAGGRYVKHSLAFADGGRSLTWKLDGGVTRSAPVTGEAVTCMSGTTLLEADGARVFEVLPRRRTQRGFQADVLAACDRGATVPRELGQTDVYDQVHWAVRSVKRAGTRVAFMAGYAGIGLIDGGAVRFGEPKDIPNVQEVAVGSAGQVVFAGVPQEGGLGGQRLIARMAPDLSSWDRLATQGGDLVDGSLAVGDDGRVTWQLKAGPAQSTPLAGETVSDCTTGTTLIDKDGLRVSELLLAGADDARLLACVPGASTPTQLLEGPRNASWNVVELARENGRVAVFAGIRSGGPGELVISFDAAGARAGTANASVAYGSIRDVALATDGRVAVALHSGRKWRVTAFALAGAGALKTERTIAKPSDGVKAGTLAFSADGTRLTWQSRAGVARSAPLLGHE